MSQAVSTAPAENDEHVHSILTQEQLQRLNLEQIQEQLKLHQEEFFNHLMGDDSSTLRQSAQYLYNPPVTGNVSSSWSFTQGLLLGQLSVFVVIAIFIKFFVFAEQTNTVASSKSSKITAKKKRDISGIIVKRNKKRGKARGGGVDGHGSADGGGSDIGSDDGSDDDSDPNSYSSNISSILEKTYYDVNNHNPESLDWFNVLIAQMISQLRGEALLADNIYHSLNDFLTTSSMPDYLDTIKLTEIDVGDDFPIFSNCRIMHSEDGTGRLEAKIDVDLSDTLTLGIETKLLLNHPMPLTAVLPVQLSVSIVRFSGCLTVSLINTNDLEFINLNGENTSKRANGAEGASKSAATSIPTPSVTSPGQRSSDPTISPSSANSRNQATGSTSPLESPSTPVTQITGASGNDTRNPMNGIPSNEGSSSRSNGAADPNGTALVFSFSPDYRLEFTVKSLIGARAKLQDVPKISSLIDSKLRSWFIDRCIEPRYQVVKLPSLWPRSKNTREPFNPKSSSGSEQTS